MQHWLVPAGWDKQYQAVLETTLPDLRLSGNFTMSLESALNGCLE